MDVQANKPADTSSAALAARKHNAKVLFYDISYSILINGVAMQPEIDSYSKAIKNSIREIERTIGFNNYPYGMRENESICRSVRMMCDSFSKFAAALSETTCTNISLKKYLLMWGVANSKGIEHVYEDEILGMLRNGSDGRVFEVSPEGSVKPKNGAADAYTPEQLRAELDAIKKLEAELDSKNPLYADTLSLDSATKHELALQAIINSGKVSKSWDDELIEIASEVVKDFGKRGYLDAETTLHVLSDIEALKGIYSLSFSMIPKELEEDAQDSSQMPTKVPSIEVINVLRTESSK